MKCNFCENDKYVERLNSKGILELYCYPCYTMYVMKK